MSLSFGLNPWVLVPACAIAAGLAIWLYRRTTPEISKPKRIVLGTLRFVALFLILLLLLDPVLRLIDRDQKHPVVAVLVDNSESLLLTSSSDSSAASVRARVKDMMEHLPSAIREANVQFYGFDADLSEWSLDAFRADSFQFGGDRTNISHALEQLREKLRDDNLSAALLVSDGQYNSGRNPLYTAERFPVPIYTAVLGDTTRHRDVQVRRVTTNELAYVGAELPVQVGIRTEDMGGETVTVSIVRDGQVLSSQQASLPNGSTEITLDLSITPSEEGLHRYTVGVSRSPSEVTYRNNRETITVRVLQNKRSILLLAGGPDPDVASVRQLLADDETFDLTSFVQKGPGSFYEGNLPASLSEFDLIVLAGFPSEASDASTIDRIAEAAETGIPILLHLTQTSDVSRLGERLSDVLPVAPERARGGYLEAAFVPTSPGLRHPILDISDSAPGAWRRLPPLLYSQTRWQTSPDAEVLARTAVRDVELDDPLLVIRRRSQNRSAALLGAGTWRWKNVPEDLAAIDHLWPQLFSNLVQWLTAREDDRPVRVVPVRDLFGGGEDVQLTGQVYDESLNPVSDARVDVRISAPDGTVSPYVMNAIGNGRYTLDAGTFPEGTYEYEAVATHEGQQLGTDEGSFAVGSLALEFKETRANATLMRQIAHRSGGEFLEDGGMDLFTSRLSSSGALSSVIVESASEMELRRMYVFLAIIILLLTAEWFIRKRSGMV